MLKNSIEEEDIEINDCVNIHIPLVDRPSKITMTNLLGIVLDIKVISPSSSLPPFGVKISKKLYDIGTKYGRIRPLLSRNQFELCRRRDLFSLTIDKMSLISIRQAVMREANVIHGSSIKRCKCTQNCNTRRCICYRLNLYCSQFCKHDHHKCKNNEEV